VRHRHQHPAARFSPVRVTDLLYITVETVEHHLNSVYRKLNMNGRAELQEALARTTE
jgi:DNA-binding CsgD family transcriptional regulator